MPITYNISGNAGAAGVILNYADGSPKTITAGANGDYSFTVSYNWSGTVIPSKTGYTFSPSSKTYSNLAANQVNQNYIATVSVYLISGNVGLPGVTLKYIDGGAKTTVTDGTGYYSFIVPYNWSGVVIPERTGYTFAPISKTYTNVSSDKLNENYLATPVLFTLSGNTGTGAVTLSYIDGVQKTSTSDGSGYYSFTVSHNWTGTVTPSKTGYTFSPASRNYANLTTNQNDQNYASTIVNYTISGNAEIAGVTLSYNDGTPKAVTTDSNGFYLFQVPYGWSGVVTPSKSGFTFSPINKVYSNVVANQANQNFTIISPIKFVKTGGLTSGSCASWVTACSIQYALTTAISGNEIWVAMGTYKPGSLKTDTIQLKNGVSIYGGFAGTETNRGQRNPVLNITILSGDISGNDQPNFVNRTDNSYHVITGSNTDNTAVLDGFTISGGYADGTDPKNFGAGMFINSGSPTIRNLIFTNNRAFAGGGGGLAVFSNSAPDISDVTFSNNSAVLSNGWGGWGGAMYIADSDGVKLARVTFSTNSTLNSLGNLAGWGGAIYIFHCSPAFTDVIFDGNRANLGGGILSDLGSPSLDHATFSQNIAGAGGGFYNQYGNPAFTNSIFTGNSATSDGGGFYGTTSGYSSNPVFTNVSFLNNSAGSQGGGIYLNTVNATISNATFSGNSASYGGAIHTTYGNSTLKNVTFSGNIASNDGGGMYNLTTAPTIINATFYGNSANNGGALYNRGDDVCGDACAAFIPIIRNGIFWANTAADSGAQMYNSYKSNPAINNSIVQDGCQVGSTCTNVITNNPLLGTLGNFGGFTQTIPLLSGSPAIDIGNSAYCPVTDQRGVSRSVPCDLGAFEYDNVAPTVLSITRASTNPASTTSVSFIVTFSESVTGVSAGDFTLMTSGISGVTVGGVSGSGDVYTVTVNTGSGNGTIRLDVTDDDTIKDVALNPLGGLGAGNDNFTSGETYTIDRTPPSVNTLTRPSVNPTSATSVDFTVTFSESVTGVNINDFSLTTTGVSGAFASGVSGSGSVYTVTVNTGSGNGTIRLDVSASATVNDLAANPLVGLPYTSGETYTISKSAIFTDVPYSYWANSYIERLANAGITGGCATGIYCPDSTVTRAQMAVFLLKGMHGSSYVPPTIGASSDFNDVATDYWAAAWIKQLAAEGITGGCGTGIYCPDATVTRAQMAVFLLKAKHGSNYIPSSATGVFTDVPVGYWADKWIEQLASEAITGGCGIGIYCPDADVTRAQMAVFLVKAFNLP